MSLKDDTVVECPPVREQRGRWHWTGGSSVFPTALRLARASQVDQAASPSRMETFAHSRTHVTQLELRASSSCPLATAE